MSRGFLLHGGSHLADRAQSAPESKTTGPARRFNANDYNNEFYKTQYEILKSPALAERVIREEALKTILCSAIKRKLADNEGDVDVSISAMGQGFLTRLAAATSGPA